MLQILKFEFQKFRILEILNFHPCLYMLRYILRSERIQIFLMGSQRQFESLGLEFLHQGKP